MAVFNCVSVAKITVVLLFLASCDSEDYFTVITATCPTMCNCININDTTDCQNNELIDLPANISPEVKTLDLSHNYFKTIPKQLSNYKTLTQLILAHNQISEVDKSILNIASLEKLDLTNNNLKWHRVHPSTLNLTASINELDLSHNPLRNLNISFEFLKSRSLSILRIRNCSFHYIPSLFLTQLTALKEFDISDNEHLRIFHYMKSSSLETLDASRCDLDEIDLSGFMNLKTAILKGNRISKILPRHFRNTKLEILDLSDNTIKIINQDGFIHLPNLISLNLSMNVFIDLHVNTFSKNEQLRTLLISRTYLQKMVAFHSSSLRYLDLSINEIQDFNENSLVSMPSLQYLILSNNMISKLPQELRSHSLLDLDLSNCRITEIKNNTLIGIANLRWLKLAGNKLTSLQRSYLPKDLHQITLENNLWRCDCFSKEFRDQYDSFTKPPELASAETLKCNSPENVSDFTWDQACGNIWYNLGHGTMHSQKIWMYIIAMTLGMSVIFCATMCIRRMYQVKIMREQAERQRMRLEAQERINRLRIEQQRQIEAQQNAPDPRELVRPPSYHEAIRMPRLDTSYSSLVGSRPSLAASNPELSKQRSRDRSASKASKRRSRTPNSEEGKRRRRRRRRYTGGSTEENTEGATDNDAQGDICTDDEITRSMISLSRNVEEVDCHIENEVTDTANRNTSN